MANVCCRHFLLHDQVGREGGFPLDIAGKRTWKEGGISMYPDSSGSIQPRFFVSNQISSSVLVTRQGGTRPAGSGAALSKQPPTVLMTTTNGGP